MIELKIDPEFKNLIPKLTDAEYAQLEKNILADGKVKEPIVVWNGTIIDGHHRYYIVQKHPNIPFQIEEKDFANRYAAMAWACANQLGRRNLSPEDKWYLIGKRQESESMSQGGDKKSAEAKSKSHDATLMDNPDMASKIAEDEQVNRSTVFKNEQYAKGIDTAEEIVPGMKEELMHGDNKVPKYVIEKIPKVTPDKQRKAVIAISNGEIQKAKDILEEKKETLQKYGLNDDGKDIAYTVDDLLEEVTENFKKCMESLKTTVSSHRGILDEGTSEKMSEELSKLFKDFMEEI